MKLTIVYVYFSLKYHCIYDIAARRRKYFTEKKENSFFFTFFKTNFILIILKTKYLKKNGRIHLLFIDFGAKQKSQQAKILLEF